MKSILIIIGILTLLSFHVRSQTNDVSFSEYTGYKSNAIYLEASVLNASKYGYGYPSLNYERYIDQLYRLSLRFGVSTNFDNTTNLQASINWLTASLKNHHIEFGAGTILSFNDYTYEDNNVVAYGVFLPFMYRYQRASGIIIRAGANAVFGIHNFIAPGVSLGYNF